MNDDISNILEKFKTVLNEKDIDLNEIISDTSKKDEDLHSDNNTNTSSEIDIDTILKIKEILTKMNKNKNSPRNILLNSLKPYLKDDKQTKLNQYIKIANLLSIIDEMNIDIPFLKNENKKGYDSILIITLLLLIL